MYGSSSVPHMCSEKDLLLVILLYTGKVFPGGASDREPTCQCRRSERHRFDP